MAFNNKYVTLDMNQGLNRYLLAKSQDNTGSRSFTFKIVNNNVPYSISGYEIRVAGHKPDGKGVLIDTIIKDESNSIIEFELTTQMMLVPGILELELLFIKDCIEMSSMPFQIKVLESARNNKYMTSSNEYQTLVDALIKVDDWDRYFTETSGKIEEKYTERLNNKTKIEVCKSSPSKRESGTFYFVVSSKVSTGGGPATGSEIKVSPTMGIKLV